MGVIIVSLIVASIGLPLLLNGLQMPAEPSHQAEENAARVAAADAAIAAVERIDHARAERRPDADLHVAAASRIMDAYRQRLDSRPGHPYPKSDGSGERGVVLVAHGGRRIITQKQTDN